MKKHIVQWMKIQWMKTLACWLVLFTVMTPIPVHATDVPLNVWTSFGKSNYVSSSIGDFYEEGFYMVTNLDEDNYYVKIRYDLVVDKGYSYQIMDVYASIDNVNVGSFSKGNSEHLYKGRHVRGETAPHKVKRGTTVPFTLYDYGDGHEGTTTISISKDINIALPQYTVTFTDGANTTLKTQTVTRHDSATAPNNPAILGYTFQSWDRGWSPVTSNITVTALWTRNSPAIRIRESVYEKGQRVTTGQLIENAVASDEREGNITNRVVPQSPIIKGNTVDTSTPGSWDIIYRITNKDDVFGGNGKTDEKHGKIIIVDTGFQETFDNGTDATIYSRNISGNALMNGQIPSNNLTPYSIWHASTSSSMNRMLNDSLHRTTPLYTVSGVYGQ